MINQYILWKKQDGSNRQVPYVSIHTMGWTVELKALYINKDVKDYGNKKLFECAPLPKNKFSQKSICVITP